MSMMQPDSHSSFNDFIDANVRRCVQGAKENDPTAQKLLHSLLCMALSHLRETGEITDFVFNEIHNQHMAIVQGENAATATRTEKPQNAPRQAMRDESIYDMVKMVFDTKKNPRPLTDDEARLEQQFKEAAKGSPYFSYTPPDAKQEEIFKLVAAMRIGNTDISWKTVKRIYYLEKKKRE